MGLSKLIEAVKDSKANGKSSGSNIVPTVKKVDRTPPTTKKVKEVKDYNVFVNKDDDFQFWASNPYSATSPREAAHQFLKGVDTSIGRPETLVGAQVQVEERDPEEEPTISFVLNGEHETEDKYVDAIDFIDDTTTFDLPTTVLTVNAEGVVTKDEPKSPDDIVCDLCNQPKHLHGAEVDCDGACDGPAGEGCECSHHNF